MRRHVQYPGIRRWSGDDLIDLQQQPMEVLDKFFASFGSMIVQGCEIDPVAGTISAGLVALPGTDENNIATFKVAPFSGASGISAFPVYLTLEIDTIERDYQDAKVRPIAYQYKAKLNMTFPGEGISCLVINKKDNIRFIDIISNNLGVASMTKKGLMTSLDKIKLDGISPEANKYTHPSYTASASGLYKITVDTSGHVSAVTAVNKNDIVNMGIPAQDTVYTHPVTSGNKHIPAGGASGQILRWSADGTATWGADNATTYVLATASVDGLMSKVDKSKLDGISPEANKYTHPSYTASASGLYKITVDTSGHVSAVTAVNKNDIVNMGIPAQDTVYTHPVTSGNKHIPAGGASGQILRWSADGTATWGVDNNTTYVPATTSVDGLMSKADKKRFDELKGLDALTKAIIEGELIGNVTSHSHNTVYEYKEIPAPTVIDVWDGSVATSFESGAGTENDPYIIKTCAQLKYLQKITNETQQEPKFYKLISNLDLNNREFAPIGTALFTGEILEGCLFSGVFDGNGCYIKNLKITYNANTLDYGTGIALFGALGFCSTIGGGYILSLVHDLGIESGTIEIQKVPTEVATEILPVGIPLVASSLCGFCIGLYGGGMYNCFSKATVRISDTSFDNQEYLIIAAGLIGYGLGDLKNCFTAGRVEGRKFAVGLAGFLGGTEGQITGCYDASDLSVAVSDGGCVPIIPMETGISNCYYNSDKYQVTADMDMGNVIGKTTAQMKSQTFADLLGIPYLYNSAKNNGYPYTCKTEKIMVYDGYARISEVATKDDLNSYVESSRFKPLFDAHISSLQTKVTSISTELDFYKGGNTVTTLSNLPYSKRFIIANVASSTSISFNKTLNEGEDFLILINNTSASNFNQVLPNTGKWLSRNGTSVVVPANSSIELSVVCINSKYIIKAIS